MKGEQSPTKPKGRPKKNSVPSLADLQRLSVTERTDAERESLEDAADAGAEGGSDLQGGQSAPQGTVAGVGTGSGAGTGSVFRAEGSLQPQDCQVSTSHLEDRTEEDTADDTDAPECAEDMEG